MTDPLPAPLVPAEVDLRGLGGFMLRTDRLLSSELVALGTPEECWAAVMLWCRAWQQQPAASLPDDDRVLSSFSRTGRRWPKVKAMAMRGFIKCSDGRWYHRVLAEEAVGAWTKRIAHRAEQERNAEKLRRWREKKRLQSDVVTGDETTDVTSYETVKKGREGKGQGSEDKEKSKSIASPDESGSADEPANGIAYIPLAGKKQWAVPREFLVELETAYPRVDGPRTLLEIRAWCVSNPSNCKTERGVRRFINRWFEREQNKPVRT